MTKLALLAIFLTPLFSQVSWARHAGSIHPDATDEVQPLNVKPVTEAQAASEAKAAAEVCASISKQPVPDNNAKSACDSVVKEGGHFDPAALSICKNMVVNHADEAARCIQVIRNNWYDIANMKNDPNWGDKCDHENFSTAPKDQGVTISTLQCLAVTGQHITPQVPDYKKELNKCRTKLAGTEELFMDLPSANQNPAKGNRGNNNYAPKQLPDVNDFAPEAK